MKQIIVTTALVALTTLPLAAQEAEVPEDMSEGFSLMEEGAKLLLRGLMSEMEPAIDDLKSMTDEMATLGETMGPALIALMAQIDDIRHYETPEVLPNGDIIIRRNSDAPTYVPPLDIEPDVETGEIEL
ncbi:MAG: hypothetical protein P8J02_13895 [Yoonia sp.]|nr:hypothetical protein [Yoonia sp.]